MRQFFAFAAATLVALAGLTPLASQAATPETWTGTFTDDTGQEFPAEFYVACEDADCNKASAITVKVPTAQREFQITNIVQTGEQSGTGSLSPCTGSSCSCEISEDGENQNRTWFSCRDPASPGGGWGLRFHMTTKQSSNK
jgi:hypothetical protein